MAGLVDRTGGGHTPLREPVTVSVLSTRQTSGTMPNSPEARQPDRNPLSGPHGSLPTSALSDPSAGVRSSVSATALRPGIPRPAEVRHLSQRTLFGETRPPSQTRPGSGFLDPAFAGNKTQPVHRWVPWIAGFSKEFVAGTIDRFLPSKGRVLDPFAGVGTTLLEAVLAGHDAVGFEINPYAAFACRTKLDAFTADPENLRDQANRFLEFHTRNGARTPRSVPPPGFRTREAFYHPKILRKVLLSLDFISEIRDPQARDLFRLAFAATMVSYSNYSYEPSLGRKAAVGRVAATEFPVEEFITARLLDMSADIRWFHERQGDRRPRRRVVLDSFFAAYRRVSRNSVDLIVTSPPYLNNYHYNRNTRPQLYWLGLVESTRELKEIEQRNFGKFWQTVREQPNVQLDPEIAEPEIIDTLNELRTKTPEKGIYGGRGWANYAATYFNDCLRFARGTHWCLRPGASALVVIGNSILQGIPIPTDRFLAQIAGAAGLETVAIHVPRNTRVGNSIINSGIRVGPAGRSNRLYEAVVELKKP